MGPRSVEDPHRGVILYGEGWDDPWVHGALEYHLKFLKENPEEKFLISQCREWTIVFWRMKDSESIVVTLTKPLGEAYFYVS